MNILKKILNPWIVTLMVLTMVLSIATHLYFGSSQTSKWHFILQSYYCPEWIEPDLNFDVNNQQHWKSWYKNGQIKMDYNVDEKEVVSLKVWYENGQKMLDFIKNHTHRIFYRKAWNTSGEKRSWWNYDRIANQWTFEDWHSNGNLAIKENRVEYVIKNNWDGALVETVTEFNEDIGLDFIFWKHTPFAMNEVLEFHGVHGHTRLFSIKNWHKNGRIERSIKYNKLVVNYSYKFIDKKSKNKLNIKDRKIYQILFLAFNEESLDSKYEKKEIISDNFRIKNRSVRYAFFEKYLNDLHDIPYLLTVDSQLKNQILTFKIKVSDEKLHPFRHYSKGELEEIKRNSSEALEIKIHLTFEGEKEPEDSSEYPFQFECSYIEGPWTQYKENGDIDFVQTHNKYGEAIKIEYYKNGKVDKTYTAK